MTKENARKGYAYTAVISVKHAAIKDSAMNVNQVLNVWVDGVRSWMNTAGNADSSAHFHAYMRICSTALKACSATKARFAKHAEIMANPVAGEQTIHVTMEYA